MTKSAAKEMARTRGVGEGPVVGAVGLNVGKVEGCGEWCFFRCCLFLFAQDTSR